MAYMTEKPDLLKILKGFPKFPWKHFLLSILPLFFLLILGLVTATIAHAGTGPTPAPAVAGVDLNNGITSDNLLTLSKSTGDISGIWALRQIFGSIVDDPLSVIAPSESTVFSTVFYSLNLVLLAVSVIFLTYKMTSQVINTASTGEFLGKKASSGWVPVRMILGVGGMAPLVGGWSVAQLFAIWFAMLGVGAGNLTWIASVDFLQKGGALITHPSISSASSDLANKMFKMNVCMQATSATIQAMNTATGFSYDTTPYTEFTTANNQLFFGRNGLCGIVKISSPAYYTPSIADTFFSNSEAITQGHNINLIAIDTYNKNILQLNQILSGLAGVLVEASKLDTKTGTASGQGIARGYDAVAIEDAASNFDGQNRIMTRSLVMADTTTAGLLSSEKQRAEKQGFLTAGAYFLSVARSGEAVKDALKIGASVVSEAPDAHDLSVAGASELYVYAQDTIESMQKQATALQDSKTPASNSLLDRISARILSDGFDCEATSFGQCFVKYILPENFAQQNFLLTIKNVGDILMINGETGYATTLAMSIAKNTLFGKVTETAIGTADATNNVLELLQKMFLVISFFGVALAVYVPLIPLIHWMGGLISWMGKVIEGVICSSLLAFAHLDADADGGMGERTKHGYSFMLNLLLTPLLMVIGLLSAVVVMQVIGNIFLSLFPIAIADIQSASWTGLVSIIAFLAIFCVMSVSLVSASCDLMHSIPDKALAWIGSQVSANAGRKIADNFARTVASKVA